MTLLNLAQRPMQGVRVWLSASIPTDIPGPQQNAIAAFVKGFAELVFRGGGHILHGSHPTITPILLDAAKDYAAKTGRRDALTLAVSRHWSKTDQAKPIVDEQRQFSVVYETPEADSEEASLELLRQWMAERCDAFISIGGDKWRGAYGISGIPLEMTLAIERGLPCFMLGGFGGTVEQVLNKNAGLLDELRNGFDRATNAALAASAEVDSLVEKVYEQLVRLPLVRGRVAEGMSFRILALDGGGVKGAFTAAFLAQVEHNLGGPITKYFDLVAGTSTGGILALGLSLGIPAADLLKFYEDKGPTIFPMTNVLGRIEQKLKQFALGPKHDGDALLIAIKEAYFPDGKEKTMSDANCRLVIPSYNTVNGQHHIFRTPHSALMSSDANKNMAQVARATAAAPTYFSASDVAGDVGATNHLDGGVWANCPAIVGIMEATTYLDVPLRRIDVLSIGTTRELFNATKFKESSVAGWNKNLITLLMNAQVSAAVDHAENLVGKARFLRVDEPTEPGRFELDDCTKIPDLVVLGMQKAQDIETLSQIKSRFVNGVAASSWK